MQRNSDWKDLVHELKTFIIWILSGLIDSVFLALWALTQWVTNSILHNLTLSGIDDVVLTIFQVLFALSTLAPVVIYMYADIAVMWLRAKKRIQRELKPARRKAATNESTETVI